jgi:hypothetical protein
VDWNNEWMNFEKVLTAINFIKTFSVLLIKDFFLFIFWTVYISYSFQKAFFTIDLLEKLPKKNIRKSELILQNMLDKLVICTIKVIEDPSVEKFELLYFVYGFILCFAHL